ncbi:carboxymuconolactone decarboxylase family protein [Devosia nitrariae]|uniref:Alkyl hydroperoxide reductase AhpD n=1 Tax=Devosia nitrariae TaxID=2071872 RepID=A0ABQ5W8C1_9HYPH|nr:carboxymuconolactone decarboxylase family protein [Devosia nitrariae]GLQ56074.1 alkyl hydroperoxide reductase AhpD [Devosia nitrariae]
MQPRMANPITVLPEAFKAMLAVSKASSAVPGTILLLVHLRASQINGCSVCVAMHSLELKSAGESDKRIFAVGAWREAPWFSEEERAALALTEAVTRIADRSDPVPDDVWNEATRHFDEPTLAALVIQIGMINLWNRLNAATRQVAGQWAA